MIASRLMATQGPLTRGVRDARVALAVMARVNARWADCPAMINVRTRGAAERRQDRRPVGDAGDRRARQGICFAGRAAQRVFRPGFLASLDIDATIAPDAPFDRLFIDLEASRLHDCGFAENGSVKAPDEPGLGRDQDMAVIKRYRLAEPTVHRA